MRPHPRSRVSFRLRLPRELRGLTAVAASALALIIARPSNAGWQLDGVPLSPPPAPFQDWSLDGLAADGAGGAYAVWELREFDPQISYYRYRLTAQRVDMLGNRPDPWSANGSTMRNSTSGPIQTIGLFENE